MYMSRQVSAVHLETHAGMDLVVSTLQGTFLSGHGRKKLVRNKTEPLINKSWVRVCMLGVV